MVENILHYLEQSAKKVPNKVAFFDMKESITYEQLVQRGKQIGSYIGIEGKGQSNKLIAVYMIVKNKRLLCFMKQKKPMRRD